MSGQKMNGEKVILITKIGRIKKSDIRQQTCLFVCLLDCLFELRTQKMQFTYECRFAFIRL